MRKNNIAKTCESITHEVRTPMNGIVGAIELLRQTSLTNEQQRILEIMRSSTEYMLDVINNVINFSEVHDKNFKLPYEMVDLLTIIDNVMLISKIEAQKKGLVLSTLISANVPKNILINQTSLMQILINLIGNAIKFTKKGSILVKVDVEINELVFDIIDTGIGVDIKLQHKIFKPFFKINLSDNGNGLGLSISAGLVKLMNGKIKIQSRLGKGSHFKILLPIEKKQNKIEGFFTSVIAPIELELHQQLKLWNITPKLGENELLSCPELIYLPGRLHERLFQSINRYNEEEKEISKVSSCFWSLKILIVDDVLINQNIMKRMLNNMGHHVDLADSGSMAIALGKKNIYDMILMDLNMPIQDGFETLSLWRKLENEILDNETPIIATTAGSRCEYNNNFKMIKFDGVLVKPFNIDSLKEIIERVIMRQLERGVELTQSMSINNPIINVGGCDDFKYKLKLTFKKFSRQVEQSWTKKQKNKLLEILHSIKGCAGLVGGKEIYYFCQYLENKVKVGIWSEKDKCFLLEQMSLI